MNKKIIVFLVAFMFIFATFAAVSGTNVLSEIGIKGLDDDMDPCNPVVYGDIIVWKEQIYDNDQIWGYNIRTGRYFEISPKGYDACSPVIYENIVAWRHKDDAIIFGEIWFRNLNTGQLVQASLEGAERPRRPAIYGDYLVWKEGPTSSGDENSIYAYNVRTGTYLGKVSGDKAVGHHPVIYGDIVAWRDCTGDREDGPEAVYFKNLRTNSPIHKASLDGAVRPRNVAIYGDYLVWREGTCDGSSYTDEETTLHAYNVRTRRYIGEISDGKNVSSKIIVHSDIVAWKSDGRNADGDEDYAVYFKNLRTNSPVSRASSEEYEVHGKFAMYGDIIVWRDTNYNLYGYNTRTRTEFIITEDRESCNPSIYCGYVVWVDREQDDGYGRYLRLAMLDVVCREEPKSLPMTQIMRILGIDQLMRE